MTIDRPVDVAVIGGGHNGLICAAYLARSGLTVTVLEKNERCGGALFSTATDGVVLEHGGVEHTTIVGTPIVDELELESFGLRYLHRTLGAVHVFGDGVQLKIAETVEETAASIAEIDEADAGAWVELTERSRRMLQLMSALGGGRPVTMKTLQRLARLLPPGDRDLLELATSSVVDLAQQWFRSPYVRAMAIARTGFSGLPGWAPGTGAVFCLTPAGHGRRYSRPVGGSRAFVEALSECGLAAGVEIETGAEASSVRPDGSGRWVIDCGPDARPLVARRVVGAIPPHTLVLDLLSDTSVPAKLRARMQRAEIVHGNLGQFTLGAELDGPPDLEGLSDPAMHRTMLWMMAAPQDALASHTAAQAGALAPRPSILATFPSLTDDTLAPAGRATMWVNGFLAHRLDTGRSWTADDDARATTNVWNTLDACLPGVRSAVTRQVFTSPTRLTERTGAENAGSHLAATLDQLMGGRPVVGFAGHRTGIDGIYMTGAGTNPGPSISGLPGRACAHAVLADIGASGPVGRGRLATAALAAEVRRARELLAATWLS